MLEKQLDKLAEDYFNRFNNTFPFYELRTKKPEELIKIIENALKTNKPFKLNIPEDALV
jgi:hypothetical protein